VNSTIGREISVSKERKKFKQGIALTTNQSTFRCIKTLWENATAMLFPYLIPKLSQSLRVHMQAQVK
jgi:hypothetical protein